MKLVRYGDTGAEKPGLMDGDTLRDLSSVVDDVTGATLDDATLDKLRAVDPATLPAVDGNPRIGPCVGNIGKFMCIGLNYKDHAIETGNPFPDHPILFMKANSAIVGPNDDTVMPRGSTKSWASSSESRPNMSQRKTHWTMSRGTASSTMYPSVIFS